MELLTLFALKFDIMKLYLIGIGGATWLKFNPMCQRQFMRHIAMVQIGTIHIYDNMYDLEGQIAKWLVFRFKVPVHLILIQV